MRQTFRQEEAEQILRDAVRREAEQQAPVPSTAAEVEVSQERLVAMAVELGISPAALEAVLRDREAQVMQVKHEATEGALRQEFITHRRASFMPHLYSYAGVNGMLFCIWLLTTPGGYPWFVWPMLGWGLGLYFHAMATLPTRGPNFERDFVVWKAWNEKREIKYAKRNARRIAESELDE